MGGASPLACVFNEEYLVLPWKTLTGAICPTLELKQQECGGAGVVWVKVDDGL